jgi:hypothetical protein
VIERDDREGKGKKRNIQQSPCRVTHHLRPLSFIHVVTSLEHKGNKKWASSGRFNSKIMMKLEKLEAVVICRDQCISYPLCTPLRCNRAHWSFV